MDQNIQLLCEEATNWRHMLHQHPETSFQEKFASTFIAQKLSEWHIPFVSNIAQTGIVATIEGKHQSDKKIALRADIDALAIEEENLFEYKSKNSGFMHACGHDGHTAMLLGAGKYLSQNRDFSGTVYLIFQPAEEGGAGAHYMMEEGLFDQFPADSIWGMHNIPGLPVGHGAVRAGSFMASCNEFTLKIIGQGGHAAMPHLSNDPILAGSQIIESIQHIISKNINAIDSGVLTITQFHAGTAFNIIPDIAVLKGTLRAFNSVTQTKMIEQLETIAKNITAIHHTKAEFSYESDPYPALINSKPETKVATKVAQNVFGVQNFKDDIDPLTVSEDFAFMLEKKPGCYILLGNGEQGKKGSAGLHTAQYDFNDDALYYGINYWIHLTEYLLS